MTHEHHHHHDQADVSGGSQARDPVCGMSVDPAKTPHHADHAGMTYHFCSAGCRSKFVSDPERYLGPPAPQADVPPGTIRSEEHTSELQSLMRISYAVFCLKKKNKTTIIHNTKNN